VIANRQEMCQRITHTNVVENMLRTVSNVVVVEKLHTHTHTTDALITHWLIIGWSIIGA